jgi:hypothetical protein
MLVAFVASRAAAWEAGVRFDTSSLSAGSPTFIWLLLAYATVIMTFGEATENECIRFTTDPLVTVIVAALAVGLYRRLIRFSGFSYSLAAFANVRTNAGLT